MRHGSAWSYNNHKCRCDLCKEAATNAQGRSRRKRYAERELIEGKLVATGSPRHGVATIYRNWGCRCDECTEAHASNVSNQRRSRR